MSEAHPASIEVDQLVKEFKKGPRAVDGLNLRVAPGEIYGFLGPNGAGKSTTVHMLTTLLPPDEGTARVAGYDVRRQGARVRKNIGAALQEAALDPFLTARDHMRLQTALHGLPRAERRRRGDELIERVGLADAADRRVGGYSGGMKRRLDLALALVHRPRILFLDEPTTGLDIQSRSALWGEVERLSREDGVTVFLTTQYLEEADVLAHRVGIIDHGRLVAEGTPTALKAEIAEPSVEVVPVDPARRQDVARVLERFGGGDCPRHEADSIAVRLGGGSSSLADVVRALDAESIEVSHLQLHAPTLDDVFLAKTGRSLEGAGEEEGESPPVSAPPRDRPEEQIRAYLERHGPVELSYESFELTWEEERPLSPQRRREVAGDLARAGIAVEPPLERVSPGDRIRVSLVESPRASVRAIVIPFIVMAIGAFGPWAKSIYVTEQGIDGDGWGVIGAGAAATVLLILHSIRRRPRLLPALAALGGAAAAALVASDFRDFVDDTLVSPAWGLYACFAGSALLVIVSTARLRT